MKKLLMTASTWGHLRTFHLPYLEAFRGAGWEVHIGCANPPSAVQEADKVYNLPFEKKMTALGNFAISRGLRRTIVEEGYDLVICHTSLAAFFTRLAMVGMKNRPRVINMVHGYLFDDGTPAVKRAVYLKAEQLTAPMTDVILTMNQWDYDTARGYQLGGDVGYVQGIGVPLSKFSEGERDASLRYELGVGDGDTLLIYPAEFSKRKNQTMLISAMEQLPPSVHLLLPGRGDLLEQCKGQVRQLGLEERIHFPGYVSDLPRWYGAADIAVSVSRSEGLPLNVMEAMASGLPVVASNIKGHVDLVTDGISGLLFDRGDSAGLVAHILSLVEDGVLRERLSQRGRAAVEPFGLEQVMPAVMAAYGQPMEVLQHPEESRV